ncbi:MAG: cyclic nucleotide-binding domain-containing protein [Alphaproteobacteria bacterium]|nr:cyclic nucleotide-binding domain-containing protein [Alphaproteobacteria bacterium]
MKRPLKTFADGKIIFKEGEQSHNAFVIHEGDVVLTKTGSTGSVQLAVLKSGDMLGEMGLLDDSPRSATAKAVGKVTVEVISREKFLKDVQDDPKTAIAVIERLVARLRKADEMLAEGGLVAPNKIAATAKAVAQRPAAAPKPAAKPGFISRLFGQSAPTQASRTAPIEIIIVPLLGDKDSSQSKLITKTFDEVVGVRAKYISKSPFTDKHLGKSFDLKGIKNLGRKLLTENNADLLIFGNVPESDDALSIRFLNIVEEDSDRQGSFTPAGAFALPKNFEGDLAVLLKTITLAALAPRTENQMTVLRAHLPSFIDQAKKAGRKPPLDLNKMDQAKILLNFASAAAFTGTITGTQSWLDEAKAAYQASIRSLARSSDRYDWALAHFQLGKVLQVLAEKSTTLSSLSDAEEAFNNALTIFSKADNPYIWATIQNRLGQLFYKMDIRSGSKATEPTRLKEATTAYQNALQVFTMAETPMKWAEVKHNLAQSLQILGGHAHSIPLLEKAAEASKDALDVRARDRYPMAWAATTNSLGSALFLIARQKDEPGEEMAEAEEAFRGALEVYKAHGAAKLAKVAHRNLNKVKGLLAEGEAASAAKKPLGKFSWDDEEDEGEEEA